ncbi:transcriptional regulator, AsnC family [Pedobacter rhizosphaerae]|uniref:Transcriptional regulator, AsnC family n=2 Tax=Pedobacter rhizosphaerae TaxID=390241 RepID=A0A1H9VKF0_9SPHI|nr:transcriptional regulator, AsnC family [Pedobacter rhizosphaerae]
MGNNFLYFEGYFAILFHHLTSMSKSQPTSAPLDHFDLAILRILQENNYTPQRSIAESVNLSAAAVHRRIKRMEENGTIQSQVAVVDPIKVAIPITIMVEVEMENDKIELVRKAKQKFCSIPEIQQCYYVTGEVDFILIINVANMTAYEALTTRLFFDNPDIKRFRTFVTLDRVKVGLSLPI